MSDWRRLAGLPWADRRLLARAAGMLAHYATSVILTVVIGVSAGLFVARRWPRVFALMNGGRAAIG